jgi:hypothetical protein
MNLYNSNEIDKKLINEIARNYNPLDYNSRLIELLNTIYPTQNFDGFTKYELHELLNEVLLANYNGEQVFKYKLFQQYFNKKSIVAAFEIKVNNSRADFLTINGHTTCFEIKTGLDNLSKFRKQAIDYMLAFEYNYLIVDERHLEKASQLLPDNFGLWLYQNGNKKQIKKAELSTKINPEIQLRLLTKQELIKSFPEVDGVFSEILISFNENLINSRFKKTLKRRYQNRWDFLVSNEASIFPIDLQFFFNTNILPSHIYYH